MMTNGVQLDNVLNVAKHLDFVRVSMDACDEDTYNLLHGVEPVLGHFGRMIMNTLSLVKKIGGTRVRVGYLVTPPINHQRGQIIGAAELCHDMGVGHIAFRPALLGYKPDQSHWEEAVQAIEAAKNRFPPGFVLCGSNSWELAMGKKRRMHGLCRTRPLVMCVKSDGTIPSCFLYRERLQERPAIGNISDGFANVWFSEKHRESLRVAEKSKCPQICRLYAAESAFKELSFNRNIPILEEAEIDDPYFI